MIKIQLCLKLPAAFLDYSFNHILQVLATGTALIKKKKHIVRTEIRKRLYRLCLCCLYPQCTSCCSSGSAAEHRTHCWCLGFDLEWRWWWSWPPRSPGRNLWFEFSRSLNPPWPSSPETETGRSGEKQRRGQNTDVFKTWRIFIFQKLYSVTDNPCSTCTSSVMLSVRLL